MKVEVFEGGGYQMVVDSKGNGYVGSGGMINGWDIKAGKLNQRKIPNPKGGPQMARRGHMDPQDRYWFGNYYGDSLGMFDTKTETCKQWPLRKWSTPYAASIPDKKGRVYLGSNMSQRDAGGYQHGRSCRVPDADRTRHQEDQAGSDNRPPRGAPGQHAQREALEGRAARLIGRQMLRHVGPQATAKSTRRMLRRVRRVPLIVREARPSSLPREATP